jgi:hypothetical protein
VTVAGIAAVAAAAVTVAASSRAGEADRATGACGVERWTVKTLQDRPQLLPVQSVTIAYLATRPRPRSFPAQRLPFERHVFRVEAAVTLARAEDDGDLHLVLESGSSHMIAEAPSPACTSRATAAARTQMTQARRAAAPCARAVVTGVAFFDYFHGQTGIAPNAIELHPILGFRCLATPTRPPPRPSSGGNCAASYPGECIAPPPPDLDCADIPYRDFRVLRNVPYPDPHRFDADHDGIGCET